MYVCKTRRSSRRYIYIFLLVYPLYVLIGSFYLESEVNANPWRLHPQRIFRLFYYVCLHIGCLDDCDMFFLSFFSPFPLYALYSSLLSLKNFEVKTSKFRVTCSEVGTHIKIPVIPNPFKEDIHVDFIAQIQLDVFWCIWSIRWQKIFRQIFFLGRYNSSEKKEQFTRLLVDFTQTWPTPRTPI